MADNPLALRVNRRRMLQAGALGAAAPALLGRDAARAAAARAQTAPTGVLQLGRASEVAPVWSPLKASTGVHAQVFDLIFNRLARFDANLQLIPDLAEEIEISPDATVFTFRLRQGATWHDGQPFTSRDVIFTYKLALTKAAGARQYGKLSEIKGAPAFYEGTADDVEGLQAPDDYTVVITLEKPDVAFYVGTSHSNAMLWILPEHILRDMDPAGIEQHPFTLKPDVGTGPYRWVDYVPDQYLEFSANTAYFKGSPKIEKVFIRLAEPATALAQLESGELHVMPMVAPRDAERLQDHALISIVPAPGVGVFQTAIFNEKFPDKRFRQALMYGVDRAALIDVVLRGQGRLVFSTVIGPEWATYDDLNPYAYNPEMAKQLLTEASWDSSRKVVLNWPKGFQAIELAAPVFQQQLAEVGLEIVLEPLDTPAFVKKVVEEPDFELAWFSGGVYGMDPDVSAVYYTCANFTPRGANTTHYCNDELDALFVAGRGTSDVAERTEIYHQVAKTLNEDIPTIFWWSENIIWGINKQVQGVQPGPNPDIQWNIEQWSLTS